MSKNEFRVILFSEEIIVRDEGLKMDLNVGHVVDLLNGMRADALRIAEAVNNKGLTEGNETPLGTVLRMIEAWPPVVKVEEPAEANCATGLKPLTFKAEALAQVIVALTRSLQFLVANHRMNNGLYPGPIQMQMDEMREQRAKLVEALVACES